MRTCPQAWFDACAEDAGPNLAHNAGKPGLLPREEVRTWLTYVNADLMVLGGFRCGGNIRFYFFVERQTHGT